MQKSIGRDAKMQPLRLSPLPPNQGLSPLPPIRNKCAQRWIPVSLPMLFCIFSVDFYRFSAFSAFLLCWGEWGRGPGVVSSIYTNAFLHFWVGFLWVFCILCIFREGRLLGIKAQPSCPGSSKNAENAENAKNI